MRFTNVLERTGYIDGPTPLGRTTPSIIVSADLSTLHEEYGVNTSVFSGTKAKMNQQGFAGSNYFTFINTIIPAWAEWESYGGGMKPWYSLYYSSMFYKIFEGVRVSRDPMAVLMRKSSALSTLRRSSQTTEQPETPPYGKLTVGRLSSSGQFAVIARVIATTQSSAGMRRTQPPVLKPMEYAGAMALTALICLAAFGIGSILGWIWPDGLRSEK
ncbi:uncharacterized protein ColSpa_07808 [Colletotrichum spaethianum]|uniref:Uncharacterized protein n=1 Tax=Colletotrichum spaethianum TaxID=700344 RepID=A0AA37UPT6_9PEZI|nr:uncharacterized protein ColSpa_07808 [Colletotrichum spaethianum]GKT47627.1 hypothetical protein ColSpa_07808 [Colletotrichum spaethianum]